MRCREGENGAEKATFFPNNNLIFQARKAILSKQVFVIKWDKKKHEQFAFFRPPYLLKKLTFSDVRK